jgi:hypothetical protein
MTSGDPGYAHQKLTLAVHSLAVGAGDVRSRLRDAFLILHVIHEQDFPDSLKNQWRWIKLQVTKFGPREDEIGHIYQGSIDNTLGRIKNSTGTKIAAAIVALEGDLEGYLKDLQ